MFFMTFFNSYSTFRKTNLYKFATFYKFFLVYIIYINAKAEIKTYTQIYIWNKAFIILYIKIIYINFLYNKLNLVKIY